MKLSRKPTTFGAPRLIWNIPLTQEPRGAIYFVDDFNSKRFGAWDPNLVRLSRAPMIGIALIRVSHSRNKEVMTESFGSRNGLGLRLVINIRDPSPVHVFQNILRYCASFWATLWFWFDINIRHIWPPL
jgi:hypothetical protein